MENKNIYYISCFIQNNLKQLKKNGGSTYINKLYLSRISQLSVSQYKPNQISTIEPNFYTIVSKSYDMMHKSQYKIKTSTLECYNDNL